MIQKRILAALLCLALFAPAAAEGADPRSVAEALYRLGYRSAPAGESMDEETLSALRSFQIANGLPASGETDPVTLSRLFSDTAINCHDYLSNLAAGCEKQAQAHPGESGGAVLALQRSLKALGYFPVEEDGVYGEHTRVAVRRFQLANGLEVNGLADASLVLRLNSGSAPAWQDFLESAACLPGESGGNVRLLQCTLNDMGFFRGEPTGTYGSETRQAVARWQSAAELPVNGDADAGTCARLYESVASASEVGFELRVGSDGERVVQAQTLLAERGYFDHSVTGWYGPITEIAVRLFQMGNGLQPTGVTTEGTLALLQSSYAHSLREVRESLNARLQPLSDDARTVIGRTAQGQRGRAFVVDDGDMYSGFTFVQYACVLSGLPLLSPEDALAWIQDPVDDVSQLTFGDVLTYRLQDDDTLYFAIAGENGKILFATQDSPWALEKEAGLLPVTEMNRWAVRA